MMLQASTLALLASLISALPVAPSTHASVARSLYEDLALPSEDSFFFSKYQKAAENYARNIQHPNHVARQKHLFSRARELASSHSLQKRQQAGYIDVVGEADNNQTTNDLFYTVTVSVGNPSQNFTLLMDTGSSELWMYGVGANETNTLFDPNLSYSYETNETAWQTFYGDGTNASGYIGNDQVILGGLDAGFTTFAVATSSYSGTTSDKISGGILGLAFSTISVFYPEPTPFENLILSEAVAAPYFAMALARAEDINPATSGTAWDGSAYATYGGSQVTFGSLPNVIGLDAPVFTYVPVTEIGYWTVESDSVVVNGVEMLATSLPMIIDSGTTNIILPVAMCDEVVQLMGGSSIEGSGGYYTAPLSRINNNTQFGFSFSGTTFLIDFRDLIFDTFISDEYPTEQALLTLRGKDIYLRDGVTLAGILGDSFLKNVVTVFSYAGGAGEVDFAIDGPSVGFAAMPFNASGNNVLQVADDLPTTYVFGVDAPEPTGVLSATETFLYPEVTSLLTSYAVPTVAAATTDATA